MNQEEELKKMMRELYDKAYKQLNDETFKVTDEYIHEDYLEIEDDPEQIQNIKDDYKHYITDNNDFKFVELGGEFDGKDEVEENE